MRAAAEETADVVVVHCRRPLSFLAGLLAQLSRQGVRRIRKLVVMSQCGSPVPTSDLRLLAETVRVRTSRNVGRCDHAWLKYILDAYDTLAPLTVFIKDSWGTPSQSLFERLPPEELVRMALEQGFGCAYQAPEWHSAPTLRQFTMSGYLKSHDQSGSNQSRARFRAAIRPWGAWADLMGMSLWIKERPFLPVCYGGGFAATASAVRAVARPVWARMEQSLRRADNIEEGHYMERSWALLLYPRLAPHVWSHLRCVAEGATESGFPFAGALAMCSTAQAAACSASSGQRSIMNRTTG
uniref:Uncharacterized protein n=1 Tax=Emiliania huxleyi TaxID=2903 RepID=A0A7S3X623_EMIHU